MARNNAYLESLLKVQSELNDVQVRLDALETGKKAPPEGIVEMPLQASFNDFLTPEELQAINRSFSESLNRKIECDKLDYALACACGVISGLIDILLVKTPHDGVIGNKADELFDKALISLADKKKDNEKQGL